MRRSHYRFSKCARGKDPMGMAAAALYIACLQNSERITQKDMAEAAGVTEVTIRNRYKALKKQLNLETPDRKTWFQPSLFCL